MAREIKKMKERRKLREENLYEKYYHPCKYTPYDSHTQTHIILNHISKSINVLEI